MADTKGIMIVGEVADGKLSATATELLGAARKIAGELKQEVIAAVIGSGVGEAAKEAVAFGADKVYVIDNPMFKDYTNDGFAGALQKLNEKVHPEIILIGQTAIGMDLAPRLAFRLGTSVTLDCVGVAIDPDTKLLQKTKPVYGGNALAVYVSEARPQMATVRVKTMEPLAADASRKGEIVSFDPGLDPASIREKVVQKVKEEVVGIKLEDAGVIVCGGRGIGGAEGFDQLKELAKLLGGALGASRPPCDSGWVPTSIQIGLTGKMVAPKVYIGIALSGSSQHQAGMSGSKNIIAINKDPEANIFGISHFGVVGDYKKVVPAFMTKCKELLAK
ncbi:MAG: electron transfer flavoprotein subunit alpha/FixB family protein [Chloroflexi bacterium]|nr:electron transfer flavoprotein subunit alpha/FixB family protein [Chloroflexota bacterium]